MIVNGEHEVALIGSSAIEVGDRLLDLSPQQDGRGLTIKLTQEEENSLARVAAFGIFVGRVLANAITEAMLRRGSDPADLIWKYSPLELTFSS